MKTLTRLTLLLVTVLCLALPAQAQTTIDSTTLSAAVSPTATVITLGSVTCTSCTFAPGIRIFVDLELMQVAGSYTSGTTVPVTRGVDATPISAHVSGAVVYLGPGSRFRNIDPPIGACNKVIQNASGYYPWFNIKTGGEWLCDNGQNAFTAVKWRVVYPYVIGTQAASR